MLIVPLVVVVGKFPGLRRVQISVPLVIVLKVALDGDMSAGIRIVPGVGQLRPRHPFQLLLLQLPSRHFLQVVLVILPGQMMVAEQEVVRQHK